MIFQLPPSNGDTVTVNGLTYSYNSTKTRWEAADSIEIVSDTSPQLGGNLDVNGNDIVSTSNGDIEIDPDGSGVLVLKGNSTKGAGQLKLNCENNSHGIVIKGPPHSAAASYTLTLPNDDGSANQVLSTDGSGVLSWSDVSESDTLDSVTDRGNTTTNDITVNSATVTVPSGGSSGFYGSSTNFGFEISDGGVGGKTIRLKNNGTSVFRHNQVQDIVDLSDASSVTVAGFTSTGIDDNATSTAITVDSSQKVGIGTTSPADELHVNATSANVNMRLTRDTNTGARISGSDGASTPVIKFDTIASGTATERMRIDGSGAVKIGGSGSGTLQLLGASSGNEGGQLDIITAGSLGTYSIDAYQDDMRFLNGTTAGNYVWYKNSNSAIGMTLSGAGNLTVDGKLVLTPSTQNGIEIDSSYIILHILQWPRRKHLVRAEHFW